MANQERVAQDNDSFGIISTSVTNAPLGDDYLDKLGTSEEVEPISSKKTPLTQVRNTKQSPPDEEEEEVAQDRSPIQSEDFLTTLDKKKRRDDSQAPKDEETEDETEEKEEEEEPSSPESIIPEFAKDLFMSGILTKDDDEDEIPEIKDEEELLGRFKYEQRKGAVQILENILSNFGDEYREAFNAIYMNGVDPKEYFGHLNRIQNISALDMAILENQKTVMKYYYKSLGWDDNKAAAKIERLENIGELESEAAEIQQTLVTREAEELERSKEDSRQKLLAEQQAEQDFENSVHRILSNKLKEKEFDGIPLDQKLAGQLNGYLTEKRWKLPTGRKLSDFDKDILDLDRPENRELKVKYALLLQTLKIDPTLSRLQKKAESKASNALFKSLQRDKVSAKKQGRTINNFFED